MNTVNKSVATAECDGCAAQTAFSSQLSVFHMILTHTGDVYSFFTWAQSEMAAAVPWPWQALG